MGRLAAAILLCLWISTPVPASAAELLVGAGEALFDLPEGVSLAGYGGGGRRRPWIRCRNPFPYAHRFKPSTGRLDPVGSRAIAFSLDGRRLAFVATDLVGVSAEMHGDVAARLADLDLAPQDLFLAATHTHSGPAGFARPKIWQLAAADTFVQELYDLYLDSMAGAVRAAVSRLEPGELAIGSGTIDGVSRNRRDPAGPLDPVATLLRFDAPGGDPIAALLTFPIHPTVLGEDNLLLSGDVAGSIARRLEAKIDVPVVFINGAEGDVAPVAEIRDPVGMEALGEKIASRAAEIWSGLEPRPVGRVETARQVQPIGRPRLNLAACLGWNRRSGRWMKRLRSPLLPTAAPVAGLAIDDHAFVSIPGELIAELGLAIKRRGHEHGFASTTILGLTNGHLGYVLTEEEYLAGGYEACASWYGPGLGDEIVAAGDRILAALAR